MTVIKTKKPLRKRVWLKVRYPGVKFSPWVYTCDDASCGCCYDKVEPSKIT